MLDSSLSDRIHNKIKEKDITNLTGKSLEYILEELEIYHTELLAQNEELKEKEEMLLSLNEEYNQLFNNTAIPHVVISNEMRINKINNKAKEDFEILKHYNLFNTSLLKLFKKNQMKSFIEWIISYNYETKSLKIDCKVKENTYRKYEIVAKNLNKKSIILSFIDIDVQTKLFEEIEILNKNLEKKISEEVDKNRELDLMLLQQSRLAQMGEIISMIAHQWRQPLGAISSVLLFIKTKYDTRSTNNDTEFEKITIEKLSSVDKYINFLSQTIDDFRNFFKKNNSHVEIALNEIIEKATYLIKPILSNKNIVLEYDFQSKSKVKVYLNEIIQVLLNIIKNSEENYVENKITNKKIKITTQENEEFFIIKVLDNGGGIKEEIKEKVFDPYFSTKLEKNGSGLGLYMSKVIVQEHHNGVLYFKNTKDGAEFTVGIRKNK